MYPIHVIGALGAAGIVGGFAAERFLSPDSITASKDGERWKGLHDDFLAQHPAPAGTRVFVGSSPAWKNAALVGGAGLGAALLGSAAAFGASRMSPQNYPIFLAGVTLATIGAGVALGAGGSWKLRDVDLNPFS